MRKRLYSYCFLLIVVNIAWNGIYAQSFDDEIKHYMDTGGKYMYTDIDSAVFYFNEAASLAYNNKSWEKYIEVLTYKTECASYHFEVDSMYRYLEKLEQVYPNISQDTTDYPYKIQLFILRSWGSYHYKTGNLSRALDKFIELDQFITGKSDTLNEYDYKALIINHVNIGNANSKKGNQETAIQHYRYAFKLADELKEKFAPNYSANYINSYIAKAYVKKEDYEKALFFYKKVIEPYQNNSKPSARKKNSLLNNYNRIATLYLKLNKPDSALYFLHQSSRFHLDNDPFYATTWLNTGKAYVQKQEYEKAESYLNKSLAANVERYGEKHHKTAEIHLETGNVFSAQNDFDKALAHYQKALRSLFNDYNDASVYSLPDQQDTPNKKELLSVLAAKAEAFYQLYLQNKDLKNLEYANTHTQRTVSTMNDIRREYNSEEARQFLVEKSYPVFEKAIEINHQLYRHHQDENYLIEAFRFAEQSKSLSLLDVLKNTDAQRLAGIPEAMLEKEQQLRSKTNHLRGKISKLNKKSADEQAIRKLQNDLLEQTQQYDAFVLELENKYPDYYQQKYKPYLAGVEEIRKKILSADDIFVAYFMGDEQLYSFFISKEKLHLTATPDIETIQTATTGLRKAIQQQNDTLYTRHAYFLYQKLLAEGLTKLEKKEGHITIVPDGGLAYIPFDILLKTPLKDDFRSNYRRDNMPYLINDYAFSYAYSATVLQQNLKAPKHKTTDLTFAGFAPDFGHLSDDEVAMRSCNEGRLQPLRHNQKEVEAIHQLIGGEIFLGKDASKTNFVQQIPKAKLLHLSTHACADEDDQLSRIYLNDDEYLTALELYSLRLQAEMVVLSACETGVGNVRRGEGVMSLARAFTYAGVPAATMSLWSVGDKPTALIMPHYYKHLKAGLTKAEALRQAKLDYLDLDAENNRDLHPLRWAAFVHIGDTTPLSSTSNLLFIFFAIAVLLGLVIVFLKKYKPL